MSIVNTLLSRDATKEIAALIETLHQTEQRLEELTAGEVDAVADQEGRTFLLREAQDQLRQIEAAKQAAILNALPAHIALLDRQGIIISVNEAWRQFGATNVLQGPGHAVGLNYLEICDAAVADSSSGALQAAAGLRSVLSGEARGFAFEYACHSPAEERWFQMTVTPLADGAAGGAVVMHVNISERKRAESALLRLAGAMNATEDAIYLVDRASMSFVHVNDGACRMREQTREALLALGPAGVLSVPLAELERSYDQIIAAGKPAAPIEIRRKRKDGTDVCFELRRQAQPSPNGWLIVTMVRDITERNRIAHAQLRSENLKRAILESSLDAIIVIDQEGLIVEFNVAAEVMFGVPCEQAIGKSMAELIVPPQLRAAHHRGFAHYLATGIGPILGKRLELSAIRVDGTEFPIELTITAIGGASNSMFAGFVRDISVRQADQAQLRDSESRFRSLTKLSSDWFWQQDEEYRFVAFSGGDDQAGWGADQFTRRGLCRWELPDVSASDDSWREHKALLADHKPFRDFEYQRIDEAGTIKFISASGEPIFDSTDRFTGYRGVATDITKRKRAEEALRMSEIQQRKIAEQLETERSRLVAAQQVAMVGSWETDLIDMSVIWSDETHRIHETDPDKFHPTHQKFLEFIHPEDRARVDEAFGNSLGRHVDNEAIEHRLLLPDGKVKYVEQRWRVIFDPQDRPMRAVGTCQDITERKQAAGEFRESERRFSDLLRNVELVAVMLDRDARITYCNDYLLHLTGWQLEEVVGRDCFEVFIPPEEWHMKVLLKALVADAAEVRHHENEILTRSGERRLIRWNNSVLRSGAGEVIGSASIGEDITERKRAENEVLRLNASLERTVEERTAELQAANQELEAFDYSVSHDLKAPIRHVEGFSTVLMEEYGDKLDVRGNEYLQRVQTAGRRMEQLVDDLLALSLVSRGELNRTSVDLSALAQEIFADLKRTAPNRNIELVAVPGLTARADRGLLRIVLENLIGNAWKFTADRDGAKIEFGQAPADGEPVYFVRDNGAGFDAAFADRLFAPFQRLHAQNEFKGTGIGLATVRRIITRHGGRIWGDGAIDAGATFHFTLAP